VRYSLLNFIACPVSKTKLTCVVTKEADVRIEHVRLSDCDRINQPGAMFGPAPPFSKRTWFTDFLQSSACETAPISRNYEAAVEEGLLISGETGRWYPIRNFIPELLPDNLRNFEQDFKFLNGLRTILPPCLFDRLNEPSLFSGRVVEDVIGGNYKQSEIALPSRIDDPLFFEPGYKAPFNHWTPEHTIYLIRLFSFCLPLLQRNGPIQVVLDAGCGYSWTTDWLLKIGFEPIGVDITRAYLDIAASRLAASLPHLVVADTENLPIQSSAVDAILCYEAFHHIPDRKKAVQQFFQVLKPGKSVVFAEPGSDHEHAQRSIDVMEKYGILERGMSLADVRGYVRGSGFLPPVQHHVLETDVSTAARASLTDEFLTKYGFTASNLYTIDKPVPAAKEHVKSAIRGMGSFLDDLMSTRAHDAAPPSGSAAGSAAGSADISAKEDSMGNVFEDLSRIEANRSAFESSRAMVGLTPPGPSTLRGRASAAIIGLMARMLWWYTHSIRSVFDAIAQQNDSQTSLLRTMLKRQVAAMERIEELHRRFAALQQQVAAVLAAGENVRERTSHSPSSGEEHLSELGLRINRMREDLTLQSRRVAVLIEEFQKGRSEHPEASSAIQAEMAAANDEQYLAFDDILRAAQMRVKSLQTEYLPYLKEHGVGTEAMSVVDIGCGTGEWLELLRVNGFVASGVERNSRIFETCRRKALKVEQADALDYLQHAAESSLGAVTALHFVEHLPYESLTAFLDETLRVLKPGGCLILETPNPENVLVGSYTFYMDPTHVRPLPSSLLKLLVEGRGFRDVEIRNLHPYPDAIRFPESTGFIGARLNQYLYGPQDYALLARKV
jgi:SAM-dependent methyltransferase/uncharacterized protein YbaR (Trm112 family)